MANLRGSSLLNYYSVKKALGSRATLKGLKGPVNSLTDKKTGTQPIISTCGATTTSATEQSPSSQLNAFREEISSRLLACSPVNKIRDQPDRKQPCPEVPPKSTPVATESLNDVKSRKRRNSNNALEVNNANPVKVMKLTTESDISTLSHSVKQISPLRDEGNVNNRVTDLPGRKKKEIYIDRSKSLRVADEEKWNKIKESNKIIDQATKNLADIRRQKSQLDAAKPDATVTKATDSSSASKNPPRSTDKIPAYERFAHKAQKGESSFVLPFKYRVLGEIFRSLDTVVSIMHNRHEICTFNKLQPAVQEMLRRAFHLHHLGQIKTVLPEAYHLKQERIHSSANFKLTVTPNMDCFRDGENNVGETSHSNKCVLGSAISKNINSNTDNQIQDCSNKRDPPNDFCVMKPSFMIVRRNAFNENLLQIVKKHHNAFLDKLNLPKDIRRDKFLRWHPCFRVDEVPDIESSELPQPENIPKYSTAKDVLTKVKGLYGTRIDDALSQVSSKSDEKARPDNEPTLPQSALSAIISPLKGIPLTLLEKIRAREAAKIRKEMTRDPDAELRIRMISRLPEIVRILRNLMISEKKAAVSLPQVMAKILESYMGSVTFAELEEHLTLITELVPEWMSIIHFQTGSFVKINKTMNFNNVINQLENAEKSAKAM